MAVQFRCVDAAIVRATAHDGMLNLPPWPDLTGDGATQLQVRAWRAWLRQVWEHDAVVEAIEVASPVLAGRVERVCGGAVQQPRRVRRVVESVIRYLLRLTTRATPFGLFAGVAPVAIGPSTRVRWGERHRAVARPDAAWLAELITQLEARPEVLRRLSVMATNLSVVRGDRLVVAGRPGPGASGEVAVPEVSLRHTRVVQTVMQAARSSITVDDLIGKLTAEFPGRPSTMIEGVLTELVFLRVLITSLHPTMDVTDPLSHVIEQLTLDADTGAWPLEWVPALRTISGQLARHAHASSPAARRAIRAAVTRQMKVICTRPDPSLAVDLRLDSSVVLPPAVAREAEAAASALVRLTPHPFGSPAWRDWHARFVERYGPDAVVPLSQIVDETAGLGFPAGYFGSRRTPPSPPLSDRDRKLLHLAQRAAIEGAREVDLDEQAISELADLARHGDGPPPPVAAAPHTELCFSLHARTTDALDRGHFALVVASAVRQAGSTAGRFLHLFDSADRERMMRASAGLPTVIAGSRLAQVSCPPLWARTGYLGRTPAIFPLIPLGEHRPADDAYISLDDLAVSGDGHRLFLVSLSRGRIIEPVVVNAVDLRRGTRPLARFLCEISTAHAAACVPFAWGAARHLPFLPRLRYGRAVLRPARWKVSAADLPGRRTSWRQWTQAWTRHQSRFRMPDTVLLGEDDVRIRLDLTEPAHRALLRGHLDRNDDAILTEAPAPDDYGWINGRAHEFVIPLAATEPAPAPPPSRLAPPSRPIRAIQHPGHAPGSSAWLDARLYGHPERQTDILTVHLPELLSTWAEGPPDGWWFLRDREPEPHLRLRIPLRDARAYGAAARRLGRWAEGIRRLGLLRNIVLDTYYPEVGRYGTGAAMRAAEAVFAADSAAAIAQLTVTGAENPHPYAVTAASFTDMASVFTGSPHRGLRWLVDHIPHAPAPALTRDIQARAMPLADPAGGRAALRALPGADGLVRAWTRRRSAVETYRAHLTDAQAAEPDAVLISLLHGHHARMIGADPDSERACFQLARAVALGWTARHADSP